jgi:HSP20 family protein
LPGPIDRDSINASLDDGVLRVTVPKPEQARPRRVEINTSQRNGAAGEPAATT